MAIRMKVKALVAAALLLLIVLWLGLAQYNNKSCGTLLPRKDAPERIGLLQTPAAKKQIVDVAEEQKSIGLSNVLKEAMQHGQVGKPTIHLVEVMAAMNHPFFMFVCSNCFCDICDKVRNLGYWSPAESQIFHHVLRHHGCQDGKSLVIDIGAHVGYFSLIAASYGCRVHSFEPNSVALRYLNLSTSINDFHQAVTLHQKGVGESNTQGEYKQTDTWALNGFVRKRRILETVEVAMLDSVVDEDVLLIKIDTEGYEANVFAGAKNLLSKRKIHHILAEVKQANAPSKRSLLHTIFTQGGFTHVYNWDEVIQPLSVPFQEFTLRNATLVEVTSIVRDPDSYASLNYQDFWFCREPLPWL